MMCGSSKKAKPALRALCPSFNARERSIKKTRRKGDQWKFQGEVRTDPWMTGDPALTSQDLLCLRKVVLEGNIQATVTVEDSMEIIQGREVHQIIGPSMAHHQTAMEPQLGPIMTMGLPKDTQDKVGHMGHMIRRLRRDLTNMVDQLKVMEDKVSHLGHIIQDLR